MHYLYYFTLLGYYMNMYTSTYIRCSFSRNFNILEDFELKSVMAFCQKIVERTITIDINNDH